MLSCLSSSLVAKAGHKRDHHRLAQTTTLGRPSPNGASHGTKLTEAPANSSLLSDGLSASQSSTYDGPVPRQLIYQVLTRSANHRSVALMSSFRTEKEMLIDFNSWEFGTLAQYILEEFYPKLSVYSPAHSIPLNPRSHLPYPKELFALIDPILEKRAPGIGPIIVDDAAGDPASLLVGVMVMGATVKNSPHGWDQAYYNQVAKDQIDFLVRMIRRTPEGAISHRVKELQLW